MYKRQGLERGADDYITMPFSLSVLRARVNTGSFLFLIVVSELHKEIIALLHLCQGFFQTSGTDKGISRFSGFSIIGKDVYKRQQIRRVSLSKVIISA